MMEDKGKEDFYWNLRTYSDSNSVQFPMSGGISP